MPENQQEGESMPRRAVVDQEEVIQAADKLAADGKPGECPADRRCRNRRRPMLLA